MSRLTKRHSDGSVGISQFRYYNYDDFQKLAKKLADYEDLEEQGLLLKLPVSLGQEVYRVNNIIIPMIVTEISYALTFRKEPRFIIQTEEKEYRGHNYYRVENIGKTVFLTKEEAEKALLKRLEKTNENNS